MNQMGVAALAERGKPCLSDNLPEGLLSINVELILIIQVDEGFE